jgi:hypothetical protein
MMSPTTPPETAAIAAARRASASTRNDARRGAIGLGLGRSREGSAAVMAPV